MEQIRYSHSGGLLGLTNQAVLEATAFLSSHLVEREHYQKVHTYIHTHMFVHIVFIITYVHVRTYVLISVGCSSVVSL